MKKLLISAWTIFAIGLVFRLLHFPLSALILILGTLLVFIHSIIYIAKNAKTNLPSSLLHLSYALLTIYILVRLQFWPVGPIILGCSSIFIIGLLVTIACFVLHTTRKIPFRFAQLFLAAYFVFFFVLSFTPAHKIYYFVNLSSVINGDTRNIRYKAWDKYSWFLYIADEQDQAIEANLNAQKAAEKILSRYRDEEALQYLTLIKQHGQQIQDHNWTALPNVGDRKLCLMFAKMAPLNKVVFDTLDHNPLKHIKIIFALNFEKSVEECRTDNNDIHSIKLKLENGTVIEFIEHNTYNVSMTVVNDQLFSIRKLLGEMFLIQSEIYFHYETGKMYKLSNGNMLYVEQPASWSGGANSFDFYQYFDLKKKEIIQFVEKDDFISTLK